jgi:hypothetical protein
MRKTSKKTPGADEIAEMATRGENVSGYFTNRFTVVRRVHRVNVDLTHGMLRDLDARAAKLNISRQAVIKTLLGRALTEELEHKPRTKHG